MLVRSFFLLVSCENQEKMAKKEVTLTSSSGKNHYEDENQSQDEQKKIEIVLAKVHEQQLENEEVKYELADVQEYFDTTELNFSQSELNFVFLQGNYHETTKQMTVVGVFVNTSGQPIYGFDAKLGLAFKYKHAEIETTTMSFPLEFLGELPNDSGVLLHMDVPVEGLTKNEDFKFSDIQGGLKDVQLIVK